MLLSLALAALAAPVYDVVDLAAIVGEHADPLFLDDIGRVGGVATYLGSRQAFWWDGVNGVQRVSLAGWSTPRDMNRAGQMVGQALAENGESHAFYFDARAGGVRDLGTLGAGWSVAVDVNELGEVAGNAGNELGQSRAFWWAPGLASVVEVGTLGGAWSRAHAVLETGEVLGVSSTAIGEAHPFLWDPVTRRITDLGTLGGAHAAPTAVNAVGQIAGWSEVEDGTIRPFFWDGAMEDLGGLGGRDARPTALNDAGQVVGWALTRGGAQRAWLWDSATDVFMDLGTLGGAEAGAVAVNARGQVTGWAAGPSGQRAFLWEPRTGRMREASPHGPSAPLTVGPGGEVVGTWTRDGEQRGFVWTQAGWADLGDRGGLVRAVNARGEVVGWNDHADGDRHGYIARPLGRDTDGDGVLDGADTCPLVPAAAPDLLGDGCVDVVCDVVDWLVTLPPEDMAMPWGTRLVSKAEDACASATGGRPADVARTFDALLREAESERGKKVAAEVVDLLARLLPRLSGG